MTVRKFAIFLCAIALIPSCSERNKRGKTIHGIVFIAEDAAAFESVRDDFEKWISLGGFNKSSTRDAIPATAGFMEEGQQSTWYVLEKEGKAPIHLRTNLTPGKNTIYVDLGWLLNGTDAEHARLEQRVREFHKDLIIWFLVRDEKNLVPKGNVEALSFWNSL